MASVGFMPNGFELKAERRKPSGEKHCDIENLPSLTGVLAHFRSHKFNAIRLYAGGAKTCSYKGRVAGLFFSPRRTEYEQRFTQRQGARNHPYAVSQTHGKDQKPSP